MKCIRIKTIFFIIGISLGLIQSCTNPEQEVKTGEEQNTVITAPPEDTLNYFIISNYLTTDPEKWKNIFESNDSIFNQQQIRVLKIFKEFENANSIFVLFKVSDVKEALTVLSAPGYLQEIAKSGSSLVKETVYHAHGRYNPDIDDNSNYLLINHKVNEFSEWKGVFEASENSRLEKGIEMCRVFTTMDNANDVSILFSATMDSAKKHFTSPGVQTVIKASGVIGDINVKYLRVF